MLNAGPMGDHRNMQMFSWYFAPVVLSEPNAHPICANLDPVHFDFAGTIDTVNAMEGRSSTVLLASSPRSLTYNSPVRVGAGVVELPPDHFETGRTRGFPLALLLEGAFESFYAMRLGATLREDPDFAFRKRTDNGKIIVVSDADFIRNQVRNSEQGAIPMPLGFDRYSNRVIYDNKEWLLNAMSYLLDDEAAISLRSRTIAFRPLDEARIRGKEGRWSMLAVGGPIGIVILTGWLLSLLRKRRWTPIPAPKPTS